MIRAARPAALRFTECVAPAGSLRRPFPGGSANQSFLSASSNLVSKLSTAQTTQRSTAASPSGVTASLILRRAKERDGLAEVLAVPTKKRHRRKWFGSRRLRKAPEVGDSFGM